jgi:acetyl esterase/lipase
VVQRLPSPSKLSIATASHSAGGTLPLVTAALRRSVRFTVLTAPLVQAVPGSEPSWPKASTTLPLSLRPLSQLSAAIGLLEYRTFK